MKLMDATQAETYPFSRDEYEWMRLGSHVIPQAFTSLSTAVRSDCRRLLCEISLNLEAPLEVDWLDRPSTRAVFLDRLSKALDLLIDDIELGESGDSQVSEFVAASTLLNRAIDAALNPRTTGTEVCDPPEDVANHVVSAMAALLIEGRVREAISLRHLAGALAIINDTRILEKVGSIKEGKAKELSAGLARLKLLRVIHSCLNNREIPTKKYVCDQLNIDPARSSRLLKAAGLQKMLPESKMRANEFRVGEVYRLPEDGSFSAEEIAMKPLPISGQFVTPASRSHGSEDRDIYALQQRLGPLYQAALLAFEIPPLRGKAGLEIFESKLREVGLSLNWNTLLNPHT